MRGEFGRLEKFGYALTIERRFATEDRDINHIDSALQIARLLLSRLDSGEALESMQDDLRKFLQEWEPTDTQERADEVLDDRFDHFVGVYHLHPIRVRHETPPELLTRPDERAEGIRERGFQFKAVSRVLRVLGLWERIQKQCDNASDYDALVEGASLEENNNPTALGALNGELQIDYEALFPETHQFFRLIKLHKYHQAEEQAALSETRSVLSVADILMAVTVDRLNSTLSADQQEKARTLTAKILDTRIPNTERITLYQELDALYQDLPQGEQELITALQGAVDELSLPKGHEGRVENLDGIDCVDAAVILSSADWGKMGYLARELFQRFPDAFALPTGRDAPHQTKEQLTGEVLAHYTEADEQIANLTVPSYRDRFAELPDNPKPPPMPPLARFDILVPDRVSGDTHNNAAQTRDRLAAIHDVLQRDLSVVIVTSAFHSARAYGEFRTQLSRKLVPTLKVWEFKDLPEIAKTVEKRKPTGLGMMFAEYAKRLYDVSVRKSGSS